MGKSRVANSLIMWCVLFFCAVYFGFSDGQQCQQQTK